MKLEAFYWVSTMVLGAGGDVKSVQLTPCTNNHESRMYWKRAHPTCESAINSNYVCLSPTEWTELCPGLKKTYAR
jgi:hypothetical protein